MLLLLLESTHTEGLHHFVPFLMLDQISTHCPVVIPPIDRELPVCAGYVMVLRCHDHL